MGKKAQEYLRTRRAHLPPSSKRHTTLVGVDEEEQEAMMQMQQLSDEFAAFTSRGLVPVAIDFAQNADKCGVPHERSTQGISSDYWVPAWYLAAWHSYQQRFGESNFMNEPTTKYKQFIENLIGDPHEQVMLVAETTLSTPHQGKAAVNGIRSWLELNT